MDTFSIFISKNEYTVHASEHGHTTHYSVRVSGKDILFIPDESGDLITIEKDEPVLYTQMAEAIEAHFF